MSLAKAQYRLVLLALAFLALVPGRVLAVQPDEMLKDPVLEARARAIGQDLRCLVCQNQSIDDSDASLARDLRILIRERLTAGDNDKQVMDFVVARYGSFVLLRPPFEPATALLWLGPLAMLLGACAGFYGYLRSRSSTPEPEPLTPEEQRHVAELIDEGQRQ
jgi:cytochrome c-type biogenesis protein CcmH